MASFIGQAITRAGLTVPNRTFRVFTSARASSTTTTSSSSNPDSTTPPSSNPPTPSSSSSTSSSTTENIDAQSQTQGQTRETTSASSTTPTTTTSTTSSSSSTATTGPNSKNLSPLEEYESIQRIKSPSYFALRFSGKPGQKKDYIHDDELLLYVTNLIMVYGKKEKARHHIGLMLQTIRKLTNNDPLPLFRRALELGSPHARLKTYTHHNKNFQVPYALFEKQRLRLGFTWIKEASLKRKQRQYGIRLGEEIVDILNGSSSVLERKALWHRQIALQRGNMNLLYPQSALRGIDS